MTPAHPDFPAATLQQWKAVVAKGRDDGSLPPEWFHDVDDGTRTRPLYWGEAADRESSPPGRAPYVRGCRADPAPACNLPRYEPTCLADLMDDVAADAHGGVRAFWIRSGANGPLQRVVDVHRLLEAVPPGEAIVAWDAGADALAAAAILDAARPPLDLRAARRTVAFADPLATLAEDGSLPRSLEALANETVTLVRAAASRPTAVTLGASTHPYHRAGARPGQEIGFALAAGLAQLRTLLDGGLSAASAATHVGFSVSVGSELFPEIAKLRALRAAWSSVLAAHGVDAGPAWLHAVTSERTLTARDPWVNLLRVAGQTLAAVCGGADAITTACFDEVVRPPSTLGRRLARNTLPILLDECFTGDVLDPAGGAYGVESLTEELGRTGWQFFQEIERQGSLATALRSGWVQDVLAATWERRRSDLESGRAAVTGVSVFANPHEVPLDDTAPTRARPSAAPAGSPDGLPRDAVIDLPPDAVSDPSRLHAALVDAARAGAGLSALASALSRADPGDRPEIEALPCHRDAELFESRS